MERETVDKGDYYTILFKKKDSGLHEIILGLFIRQSMCSFIKLFIEEFFSFVKGVVLVL